MTLKINNVPIVAQVRKLKVKWTLEAQQDIEAWHGTPRHEKLYQERLKVWQEMKNGTLADEETKI